MAFEADVDVRKTLPELDPSCFDDAEFDGYVAQLAARLAAKPLRRYGIGDLYGAIRHNVGLPWLVPLAIERLEADPFARAGEHPADLLTAVLESDTRFWQERHDLWLAMVGVMERALVKMTDSAEKAARALNPDAEETPWMPNYLGDDFMGALLHFRGIHAE